MTNNDAQSAEFPLYDRIAEQLVEALKNAKNGRRHPTSEDTLIRKYDSEITTMHHIQLPYDQALEAEIASLADTLTSPHSREMNALTKVVHQKIHENTGALGQNIRDIEVSFIPPRHDDRMARLLGAAQKEGSILIKVPDRVFHWVDQHSARNLPQESIDHLADSVAENLAYYINGKRNNGYSTEENPLVVKKPLTEYFGLEPYLRGAGTDGIKAFFKKVEDKLPRPLYADTSHANNQPSYEEYQAFINSIKPGQIKISGTKDNGQSAIKAEIDPAMLAAIPKADKKRGHY